MSHFTVLVAADENDLKARLQPYHEYECTGIDDQYVVFVEADESRDDLEKEYAEVSGDYSDFQEFLYEYCGYQISSDGRIGRRTNPNAKWDSWVVGGRWAGALQGNSFAYKSSIDWESMKKEVELNASKDIDLFAARFKALMRLQPNCH